MGYRLVTQPQIWVVQKWRTHLFYYFKLWSWSLGTLLTMIKKNHIWRINGFHDFNLWPTLSCSLANLMETNFMQANIGPHHTEQNPTTEITQGIQPAQASSYDALTHCDWYKKTVISQMTFQLHFLEWKLLNFEDTLQPHQAPSSNSGAVFSLWLSKIVSRHRTM